jgi:hypothetical protein
MYPLKSGAQHWLRDTPRCSFRGNRVRETSPAHIPDGFTFARETSPVRLGCDVVTT